MIITASFCYKLFFWEILTKISHLINLVYQEIFSGFLIIDPTYLEYLEWSFGVDYARPPVTLSSCPFPRRGVTAPLFLRSYCNFLVQSMMEFDSHCLYCV